MENSDITLKIIDINDLKLGMFVEDIVDKNGLMLIASGMPIKSTSQIEGLKKRGISRININITKGCDVVNPTNFKNSTPVDSASMKREQEYYRELNKAVSVHHEGIIRATEVLSAIRAGNPFSVSLLKIAAQDIVESIIRNPDALVSLSQLKGYDEYTYVHSVNVAILISSIANSLGYSDDRLVEIGMGGLLHDIGKMRVPEKILQKPGKLTDTEYSIMKRHPELGIDVIIDKRGISDLSRKVILQHHERYTGLGYPYGLKGERIHEIGLISAVADVYDALTSDRVYKAAWTPQRALALIFKGADKDYSRRIVEHFTKHMGIYPVGSFVRLSTNELGVVIRIDKGKLLAPVVLILFDRNGNRLNEPVKIDLIKEQQESKNKNLKIDMSLNPKAFNIDVGDYIQTKH